MYDRISNGEFDNTVPYPKKPGTPAVLLKRVQDLTDEDINKLASVKANYEEEMKAYEEASDAYTAGYADANARFRQEAIDEVGLTNHEARDRAYAYAWEQGHSSGYSDVFSYLQDVAYVILGR